MEFNMGGFVIKWVLSLAATYYGIVREMSWEKGKVLGEILFAVGVFLMIYLLATLFGFAVRTTGNYLIACIVFGVLLFGLTKIVYTAWGTVVVSVLIFWLPIYDIIRAIKYIRDEL